ncbi:MAG: hypothetical protein JJD93_07125 [Ilumatobacteraceae bacterium]|nr:hypothetical protein [Ilumatobacteraceae bacterium]
MSETPGATEWTDSTPSDPGITTLQLFAYLVEALLGLSLVAALWRCAKRARATVRRASPSET